MTSADAPGSFQEMVDVVDEHDCVVGVVTRSRMRAENVRHRAVFVAVLSVDGRLLVHRRSETKDVWPGRWDVAVGGVVASGESYDDAVRRELAEEVGISGVEPEPIGGGRYGDDDVHLIGRCYLVHHDPVHDGEVRFADGEVVEAQWVTPAELAELRGVHRFLPDSVALLLPLLPAESGFRT